jgi:imidazolonepropionase-like amidohydrolase
MRILSNIAQLYDGTSDSKAAVRTGVDLVIEGDRVKEVRPHAAGAAVGADHVRVDASGLTITPGLVDCHGHVTVLGLSGADMDRSNGPEGLVWVERVLALSLVDGGVTTMRDVGGATHRMKRLVDDGTWIGPRLKIAICMLSTTGGHADFRGPDRCHAEISRLWPEMGGRPSSIVDGPWECRKRVREIAACGADLIKLCTSPGVASPGDALEHRDFTAEEIAAICDEAGARGLKVAAHAHSASGIELAIENGVSDIQHVSFLDARLAGRAAERGCSVTPTSWVTHALATADGLSDFVRQKVAQVGAVHAEAVANARAAGLPILAGTDPVLPGMHGRNYLEIPHLVKDGLRPLEAWHAMTGRAGPAIGVPEVGTLEPGQRADLLVWRGDVLGRPETLDGALLVEVVKDGVAYRGGLPDLPQRTWLGGARSRFAHGPATRGARPS